MPADAAGFFPEIYLPADAEYKVIDRDGAGATVWTGDRVWPDPARIPYKTVAALQTSTEAARGTGEIWEAAGHRYEEVPSGEHLTTAGGVKLKVLPVWAGAAGGVYIATAFGATGDGVTDDTAAIQKALDVATHLRFPQGTYLVSTTLTADKSSLKLFGDGEYTAIIKAAAGHTGGILLDLGNATTSRYGNEIRNLGFDGNSVASLKGVRLRRINNQSKIMHCHFDAFDIALEADELALANICAFNKFGLPVKNNINIKLIQEAGNSWRIQNNYFAGGQVYLNNSMTDVEMSGNTFDNSCQLLTDGVSGPRNLHVFSNRFETTAATPIRFAGLVRGVNVHDNFFTGNAGAARAIEFTSASATLSATIADNWFEQFNSINVDASACAKGTVSLHGNRDDGSAVNPYPATEPDLIASGVKPQVGTAFGVRSDRMTFGTNNRVIEAYLTKTITAGSGVAQDVFTITTPTGAKGGFVVEVEGLAEHIATSTAVAAMGFKSAFTKVQGSTGVATIGAVSALYKTASAASASATRDVSDVAISVANTSDGVATVRAAVTYTGSGSPALRLRVRLIWEHYVSAPTLAAS